VYSFKVCICQVALIRQPDKHHGIYRDLARNALRAMFDRLTDPTLPPTELLSKPQLVVRTSCGAVARR